jgi:ATP-dependent RNA helicase DeaD
LNDSDQTPEPAAETTGGDYVSEVGFADLPLCDELRRGIAEKGYLRPTPVQSAAFKPLLAGKDLIVRSKTGTGKTAAFGIPLLERIPAGAGEPRVLVLCPTRELAIQVADELSELGKYKGSKVVAIYGGASMSTQVAALRAGAEFIVGTPGRVYDHIRRGTLDLSHAQAAVLDEADEMLSMGFFEEVTRILDQVPKSRQTLLFSATVPPDIQQIIQKYLRDPETLLLSGDDYTVEGIQNVIYHTVDSYPKPRNLLYLVEIEEPDAAIVFCNTRDDTALIAAVLNRNGYDADLLNGDLPQKERERVMGKVKAGEVRFMVATDIAARGIDISDLTHVINYSLPEDPAVYLHRVGRTGRIGKKGTAISLVGGRELVTLTALEKRYGITFEERKLPTPEAARKLWTDRHVALLREGASGAVFEAFIPLAQSLKERPDGEYLLAFALKYFFHHRQKDLAGLRTAPAQPSEQGGGSADVPAASRSEEGREAASPREGGRKRRSESEGRRPSREAPRQHSREHSRESSKDEPRGEAAAGSGKRLYLTWGEGDLPEAAELAPKLAEAAGVSVGAIRRGLEVAGRSAFLQLSDADAEKISALHGQKLEDKPLRVETARSTPRRRKR